MDDTCLDELKVNGLSESNKDDSSITAKHINSEALFAKAIIDGDQDGVRGFLETVVSAETVATMQLNTQNLNCVNGKIRCTLTATFLNYSNNVL